MKFIEATTPYEPLENEYGLMTLREFLDDRNESGKYHPSDSYQTELVDLNREYKHNIYANMNRSYRSSYDQVDELNGVYYFYQKKNLIGIVSHNTLYYNNKFNLKDFPFRFTNGRGDYYEVEADNRKQVKYFDEVLAKIDNRAKENIEEHPELLNRIKVGDFYFTVRKGKFSIVILNEEGLVVAEASDEWGATLIRVAKEYRNEGFGKLVGKYWYKYFPNHKSGGFTRYGEQNAINIWADRVRKMLENGWYTELVKDGKITKEKVKEIISGLPEKKQKSPSKLKKNKPELLIFSDDTMFYIYDKKFYEEQDEKFIYAHGFFRETSGKMFIYRLDYDRPYQKLATAVILQIAKDNGDNIWSEGPADFIEPEGLPVSTVDGHTRLDKDMLNLRDLNTLERAYRKDRDPYKEVFYSLQELADTKW